MTEPNNYLHEKGTLLVYPGGGAAAEPLPPGADGQALTANSAASNGLGVEYSDNGTGDLSGPEVSVSGNFASFTDTTGKEVGDSGKSASSFAPAAVTGGAAATKGSFTLSSGTHAKILTTAAVTGCNVVYTVVSLGTVTVASAFLTTIDTGVGFTPVASDVTDTSTVNWQILP